MPFGRMGPNTFPYSSGPDSMTHAEDTPREVNYDVEDLPCYGDLGLDRDECQDRVALRESRNLIKETKRQLRGLYG